MKKVISGASVLLTGAILFLSAFIAAGTTGIIGGWDERGRFWTAVSQNQLEPVFVTGILIMIAGAAVMIWGNLKEK